MTKPEPPKPIPLPVLLVYGKPTSPDLPQASWFRPEDRLAVRSAAQNLKFSVIDIVTEADRALIADAHEGVVKGGDRLIVGSVSLEVYQRIEEHVRKASGASSSPVNSTETKGDKPASEQNKNTGEKGDVTPSAAKASPPAPDGKVVAITSVSSKTAKPESEPARDAWDALRVGSHVLGKYWDNNREPIGWWIGVISGIDKNDFIIRWPDEPNKLPHKIERRHVAILHPSFDVAREWDKKH
jgi:hypothetical protein